MYDEHVKCWVKGMRAEECYLYNTMGPYTRVMAYIEWRHYSRLFS